MGPITLAALNKARDKFTDGDALAQAIHSLNAQLGLRIPILQSGNVLLTSVPAEIGDRNVQSTYPRLSLATELVKNAREEKFRSFSGSVSIAGNMLSSATLVNDAETWLHYYVDAMTGLLSSNLGDWGDGVFYGGLYDVHFQPPKPGGFGFVQAAKVSFELRASRD